MSVVTEETPSHEDDNINAKLLKTMKQRLSKKKEILSFMEQKAAHDFSYFVGVYFRYCSDLNRRFVHFLTIDSSTIVAVFDLRQMILLSLIGRNMKLTN